MPEVREATIDLSHTRRAILERVRRIDKTTEEILRKMKANERDSKQAKP
jgi:hypothetical protein